MVRSDKSKLKEIGYSMTQASVFIKKCDYSSAESHVNAAFHLVRKMIRDDEEGRYPLLPNIKKAISYLMSVTMTTKGSQNAADHASRISGGCDIIAMILED